MLCVDVGVTVGVPFLVHACESWTIHVYIVRNWCTENRMCQKSLKVGCFPATATNHCKRYNNSTEYYY
jgi:hypothetical protein